MNLCDFLSIDLYQNINFRAKIGQFSIFVHCTFQQNHDFGRENSSYFGNFVIKNSQKSWIFSSKIQIQNLKIF